MKKNILILLLFIPLLLNANMASPVNIGTLGTNPFLNKFVTIIHENLYIKINEDFKYADFDIEYIINSEKDGINIPLLFYASNYYTNFEVSIDGNPIELKEYNIRNKELTNFEYLYNPDNTNTPEVHAVFNNGQSETIRMNDFLYFETNISKGKHSIKVSYKASAFQYDHSRLTEKSFRYALSPANYWKSFGTLNVTIDASNCSEKITTNLGSPTEGELNSISKYHFTELPVDMIQIDLDLKLDPFPKFLLKIGYFNLALLFMLPLVYFHYRLMKKFRKRNTTSKLSAIAILGGILLPFLFIFVLIFSSFFIDYFLGEYASGREGYGAFFSFFFLPKFILVYLLIAIITDLIIKKLQKNEL